MSDEVQQLVFFQKFSKKYEHLCNSFAKEQLLSIVKTLEEVIRTIEVFYMQYFAKR